jgi:hypothetical protein
MLDMLDRRDLDIEAGWFWNLETSVDQAIMTGSETNSQGSKMTGPGMAFEVRTYIRYKFNNREWNSQQHENRLFVKCEVRAVWTHKSRSPSGQHSKLHGR